MFAAFFQGVSSRVRVSDENAREMRWAERETDFGNHSSLVAHSLLCLPLPVVFTGGLFLRHHVQRRPPVDTPTTLALW
jgi:hypothetical protein